VTSKAYERVLRGTEVHSDRPATLVAQSEDRPIFFDEKKAGVGCVDRSAHLTVRRRRSAVDMDGRRHMSLDQLATIISGSTRGFSADFQRPLSVQPDGTGTIGHYLVDLFLYVHRVDGLDAGLYFFDRRKQVLVPLLRSDQREMIKAMSCFQDIAADGSFAVSMIADLALAEKLYGERGYRLVHYEAGMIGQLLYLSAAALGFDSTGIGCFVDDAINQYLALPDGQEVIYNFTVGGAVHDPRLTSLPAYPFPDPALGGAP
jgi:SagB-type dehydrogenase family enzyme